MQEPPLPKDLADFTLDDFNRILGQDSGTLEILLKGHLLAEAIVRGLIEAKLAHPSAIRIERMSFTNKVSLAQALGVLPAGPVDVLRVLNRLRNQVAHELREGVSESDLEQLLSAGGGGLRPGYEAVVDVMKGKDEGNLRDRLNYFFVNLTMYLGHQLLMLRYDQRFRDAIIAFETRRALREHFGTSESDEDIRTAVGLPPEPGFGDFLRPAERSWADASPGGAESAPEACS